MATIILTDGTQGRRALRKASYGQSCNGCGYCCATRPCGLAREHLAGVDGGHEGPCPALECEDGRFRCGLVRHASRYMTLPNDWADPALGTLFAEALGVGRGCDASDP